MQRAGLAFAIVIALVGASEPGQADDKGAVAGAASGAVVGAIFGGPIGAAIGAGVGGVVVGSATGPNTQSQASRHLQEPPTMGNVIETTCVQDTLRGNSRCRNEVVQ